MDVQSVFLLGRHLVKFAATQLHEPGIASLRFQIGSTVLLTTVSTQAHHQSQHVSLSLSLDYAEGFTYSIASSQKKLSHDREAFLLDFVERAIRPLIPPGAPYDIRVVIRVQALDPEGEPEVAALLATSTALCIAEVPVRAITAAVYVGYIDGKFVLNPSEAQARESQMHLAVAGTALSVLTVQGRASQLDEHLVMEAIIFGYRSIQSAIDAIEKFSRKLNKNACNWKSEGRKTGLGECISELAKEELEEAYRTSDRQRREERIDSLREGVLSSPHTAEQSTHDLAHVLRLFNELENRVIKQRLLNGLARIDGRSAEEVRPFKAELGLTKKAPGSALFASDQSIVSVTASLRDPDERGASLDWSRESHERLTAHYSTQPIVSRRTPGLSFSRYREIQAAMLAKDAITPVLPAQEEFPFSVHIFSDISDFDSATLMASVSTASLALLDAGIPIKQPVAGVAMSLLTEGNRFVVLSDVLSEEELIADMALKLVGTKDGITALQMDIKAHGLSLTLIQAALRHACKAKLEMLDSIDHHIKHHDVKKTHLISEEDEISHSGNELRKNMPLLHDKEDHKRRSSTSNSFTFSQQERPY
jgi:polyribonucleotide nucleotidyltransferase